MQTLINLAILGLLAAALQGPTHAQRSGGTGAGGGHGVGGPRSPGDGMVGQRTQSGGINYAAQPAVYSVLSVNAGARTVQLRAEDGRTGDVHVAEGVYDLATLKAGDRIRVDFVAPDDTNKSLRAATIWPERCRRQLRLHSLPAEEPTAS